MSYTFIPLSDEELDQNDLIEEGVYDFEVIRSDAQTSKTGNPMAKLQLNVWDKEGKPVFIFDYLVFSNVKYCMRKIKHFCEATGIMDEYNKGEVRDDFERLGGKVHIGIQEKTLKLKQEVINGVLQDAYYPEKNIVIDYISKDNAPQTKIENAPAIDKDFNDDLPF